MKKMISLLLCAMMLLPAGSSAESSGTLTRINAVKQVIQRLYNEGGKEAFDLDLYCIHSAGSAHYTPSYAQDSRPLLSVIFQTVPPAGFTDVTAETPGAVSIAIAKQLGIICGDNATTFRPDEAITYQETFKVIISALGYGALAESQGGYPIAYQVLAKQFDIFDMLKTTGIGLDFEISEDVFVQILNKAFSLESFPNQKFLSYFTPSLTAEDCIKQYAEAVQNRNGAAQYALLTYERGNQAQKDFEAMMWTTGTSSPWVTGYDIKKNGELEYEITFHYATSTGPADDSILKITLQKNEMVYQIADYQSI